MINFENLAVSLEQQQVILSRASDEMLDELHTELQTQILNIDKTKRRMLMYNTRLVGQMEEEYAMRLKPLFTTHVKDLATQYCSKFNIPRKSQDIRLIDTWVNLQKKHEYNPMHAHDGNISWVIWVKIPYTRKQEDEQVNSKRAGETYNGKFHFVTANSSVISDTLIDLSNEYEGRMLMFNSAMWHCVYPFYSTDEYRISIAGNIRV